ncbi:pre-rRNA-processing protein pno1, variant 2 [Balamuthia mandrillaris]
MQQDENAATITVIDAEEVETSAAAAMEEGEGEWVDSADAGEETKTPEFPPLNPMEMNAGKREFRKIRVPPHRFASLKQSWNDIYNPIVTHLKLQIRMNPKQKVVELRTSQHTEDIGAIQKAADFLKAFMLGFEIKDAVALLRLEDLFVDTFEIDDGLSLLLFSPSLSFIFL